MSVISNLLLFYQPYFEPVPHFLTLSFLPGASGDPLLFNLFLQGNLNPLFSTSFHTPFSKGFQGDIFGGKKDLGRI